jgi:Ala-tRNA(Pro) deacylase
MSIAPTFQKYLTAENIEYDVIPHEPTLSSARTAEACRISEENLAKGVVLRRDRDGGYLLAVLPASRHVRLSDLRNEFGEDIEIAEEAEVDQLFWDCAHGAVPPVGRCYGLPVVVDDSIDAQLEIYMEAGDHKTLLHVGNAQFARMMADARHSRFSERLPKRAMASVVWW